MAWAVALHDDFDPEFHSLPPPVRRRLLVEMGLLESVGPRLGRPHADTLAGSRHVNMKEMRFNAAGGVWRVAFAFDPVRQAVVLVAADKSGIGKTRFYAALIAKADRRFDDHLAAMAARKE